MAEAAITPSHRPALARRPLVWAAHFFVVCASESVPCTRGGGPTAHLMLAAATAISLALRARDFAQFAAFATRSSVKRCNSAPIVGSLRFRVLGRYMMRRCGTVKQPGGRRLFRGPPECDSQLILRFFQYLALRAVETLAGAVDIECQHRCAALWCLLVMAPGVHRATRDTSRVLAPPHAPVCA
jgi:hypothetical protein